MASSDIEIIEMRSALAPIQAPARIQVSALSQLPSRKPRPVVKQKTKPKQAKKQEAPWTERDRCSLVCLLHEWFIDVNMADGSIGAAAYEYVAHEFTRKIQEDCAGNERSAKSCKAEWLGIKKDWREHMRLRKSSGMGWDERRKMCTAPPECADEYDSAWINRPWYRYLDYRTMEELCAPQYHGRW